MPCPLFEISARDPDAAARTGSIPTAHGAIAAGSFAVFRRDFQARCAGGAYDDPRGDTPAS